MNAENQNYLNIQLAIAQNELDYQRTLKSQIAELMVNYPDAGISYDMTYDQAIGLARNAASAQQAWERSIREQQLAIQRAGVTGTVLQPGTAEFWADSLARSAMMSGGVIDTSNLPPDIQKDTEQLTLIIRSAQAKMKDVEWLRQSGITEDVLSASGVPEATIEQVFPTTKITPTGAGEIFAQVLGLGERESAFINTIKSAGQSIVNWWIG
jgi:hypothetical protein